MQFNDRPRAPLVRKPKHPRPLSVGHRAFVTHVPKHAPGTMIPTDERGKTIQPGLVAGEEVEILAWRQRPYVRYHVRCVSSGVEGWLDAECLRGVSETAADGVPPAADAARPQQRETGSGAAATEAVTAPRTRATRIERARDRGLVHCPVCGQQVHPYNLLRTASETIVGCFSCHGRRS